MLSRVLLIVSSCVLVLGCLGCGEDPAQEPFAMDGVEQERWEIALVEWRIEKNEGFMDPARSPLPAAMQEGFEGLDYYNPMAEFRYRVALDHSAKPDTIMLAKRKGQNVPYVAVGNAHFRHDDQNHVLTVFQPVGAGDGQLFLPFHDKTNGETTYPGGRYLDLEADGDGLVELDFNKAYAPLCAYDTEAWNCTLPPPGNKLTIRVEAGEKLLVGSQH